MIKYSENYVAFLDILGFKDIVLNSILDANIIYQLFDTAERQELKGVFKSLDEEENVPLSDVKKYIMSDSIVMYWSIVK